MSNHIVNMSLARKFTTRRSRPENTPAPYIGRAASMRSPNSKPVMRSQISAPVALISTTNMLSYEAPDIVGTSRIANQRTISSSSSVSSTESGHESDGGSSTSTGGRSRDTMTDASSVDESYSPVSPEPNHLSCYFKPSVATSDSPSRTSSSSHSSRPSLDCSPTIPQRAASHSKKAHVKVSRKRSVARIVEAQEAEKATTTSLGVFGAGPCTNEFGSHPFGKELEQLNVVQEEFGITVRDAEAEADRAVLQSRDLAQFCAVDYMKELNGLYATYVEDTLGFPQWI